MLSLAAAAAKNYNLCTSMHEGRVLAFHISTVLCISSQHSTHDNGMLPIPKLIQVLGEPTHLSYRLRSGLLAHALIPIFPLPIVLTSVIATLCRVHRTGYMTESMVSPLFYSRVGEPTGSTYPLITHTAIVGTSREPTSVVRETTGVNVGCLGRVWHPLM